MSLSAEIRAAKRQELIALMTASIYSSGMYKIEEAIIAAEEILARLNDRDGEPRRG